MKTSTTTRHFYALAYPRNFANEYDVIAFDDKDSRDAFVESYTGKFDSGRAEAATRAEARKALCYKGDACTESYANGYNVYIATGSERWDTQNTRYQIEEAMDNEIHPAGASTTPVAL